MKKIVIKKLVLNKRTIADLPGRFLAAVRGGTGEYAGMDTKPLCEVPPMETESLELTCDQTGKTIPESNCTC